MSRMDFHVFYYCFKPFYVTIYPHKGGVNMKRAFVYFLIAIFLLLVVQPNIQTSDVDKNNRVPTNTTNSITTNENADIPQSESKATICIDPANGGTDTGYVVDENTSEKDINLTISLKIGEALQQAGYNVVYTRTDDNFETYSSEDDSAKARINLAIDQNADYFISVQMNNDEDRLTKGYSLFTQSNEDMINLAQAISEKLNNLSYSTFGGLDSDHYANFPILQDRDLPSVLLELGYLTNADDLTNLTDESFQNKIAYAIAEAFVETIN